MGINWKIVLGVVVGLIVYSFLEPTLNSLLGGLSPSPDSPGVK
jgi:hypothetical protein